MNLREQLAAAWQRRQQCAEKDERITALESWQAQATALLHVECEFLRGLLGHPLLDRLNKANALDRLHAIEGLLAGQGTEADDAETR